MTPVKVGKTWYLSRSSLSNALALRRGLDDYGLPPSGEESRRGGKKRANPLSRNLKIVLDALWGARMLKTTEVTSSATIYRHFA